MFVQFDVSPSWNVSEKGLISIRFARFTNWKRFFMPSSIHSHVPGWHIQKNRNKELHFATFHDAKSSTSSLAPRIAPNAKHRANDWKGNLRIDLKKLRDLVAFSCRSTRGRRGKHILYPSLKAVFPISNERKSVGVTFFLLKFQGLIHGDDMWKTNLLRCSKSGFRVPFLKASGLKNSCKR